MVSTGLRPRMYESRVRRAALGQAPADGAATELAGQPVDVPVDGQEQEVRGA